MPLNEVASATSRTSNVNRSISVRHDNGVHWARPSASLSLDRKHRGLVLLAGLSGRSLLADAGCTIRSRAQMYTPRSQPASLSMRRGRDFSSSWLCFLCCVIAPISRRCASEHRNASLDHASDYKRGIRIGPPGIEARLPVDIVYRLNRLA